MARTSCSVPVRLQSPFSAQVGMVLELELDNGGAGTGAAQERPQGRRKPRTHRPVRNWNAAAFDYAVRPGLNVDAPSHGFGGSSLIEVVGCA